MLVAWAKAVLPSTMSVVLVAAAVMTVGCGATESESQGPEVTLRVTRDFGRTLVAEETLPFEGHRTALRLLEESHDVKNTEAGLVEIDGLRVHVADKPGEDELIWAINLNGIEDDLGAKDLPLSPGSMVQFDLRDWYVTLDVRATVGAFPQPFTGGMLGSRFPTRVRCAPGYRVACVRVRKALRLAGVDPDGAKPKPRFLPGSPRFPGTTRRADVVVGPWKHWRDRPRPHRIDKGARYSGIFARFSKDAERLRLYDWDDNPSRSLGSGAGLVAALRPSAYDLIWFVTGTDRAGVEAASRAFNGRDLRDAFAVAVDGDRVIKLPLPPARSGS